MRGAERGDGYVAGVLGAAGRGMTPNNSRARVPKCDYQPNM
jgi:hypothetical protein